MNIEIKKNNIFSSTIISMIAIIYALLVGSGLYGFGIDYYGAYSKGFQWNIDRINFFTFLGFWLSTLYVKEIYLGVYIVTFLLTLSTGLILRENIKINKSYSLSLFLLLFITIIHTWPIIMSTSNAMRQGLAMSFVFLSLISSTRKDYFWLIIFSLIASLMHKTGALISMIIIFATFLNEFLKSLSHRKKVLWSLLIGITTFVISYYVLAVFILSENQQPTRVVSRDFRGVFVLISLIYVVFSFFFKSILTNSFNLTLFYFSFVSLAFLINGLNWQYERLGMMMLIPYILSFGGIFTSLSYKIYMILTLLLLFCLTIYTGMYTEGLINYEYFNQKFIEAQK